MEKYLTQLSKKVSLILRHEPLLYELELDEEGWVAVTDLLYSLEQYDSRWQGLTEQDLLVMIERSEKKRHELKEGKIRALYGHSVPGKLLKKPAEPPEILYHGTAPKILSAIKLHGLLPMRRQYVHLSTDIAMAKEVGRRKANTPIILKIYAAAASKQNINFYNGNELVWLADQVPAKFIDFE